MSRDVQTAFMAAHFPPGALARIYAKLDSTLPGVPKLKVRSSANAEDLDNFDGAGLHDSYSADPNKDDDPPGGCTVRVVSGEGEVKRKVHPKSLGCAVRGVYASLWNKRAIEERSIARIDQTNVAMGLVIVPAYDNDETIDANVVVVTRVMNTADYFGYSLSVQQGNNLVTNPDPGTQSQLTIAHFYAAETIRLATMRYARPAKDAAILTTSVLTDRQMVEIVDLVKQVEQAYCEATEPRYFPRCDLVAGADDKPKSLDLEIKILSNGHYVFKQVREFGGR